MSDQFKPSGSSGSGQPPAPTGDRAGTPWIAIIVIGVLAAVVAALLHVAVAS